LRRCAWVKCFCLSGLGCLLGVVWLLRSVLGTGRVWAGLVGLGIGVVLVARGVCGWRVVRLSYPERLCSASSVRVRRSRRGGCTRAYPLFLLLWFCDPRPSYQFPGPLPPPRLCCPRIPLALASSRGFGLAQFDGPGPLLLAGCRARFFSVILLLPPALFASVLLVRCWAVRLPEDRFYRRAQEQPARGFALFAHLPLVGAVRVPFWCFFPPLQRCGWSLGLVL